MAKEQAKTDKKTIVHNVATDNLLISVSFSTE